MNTIIIEKNKYMFKGEVYEESEVENIINKLGKRVRVIILAENPLIKICENIDINNKGIENYITSNLNIDEDALVDYIIDRKNKKIYIYSIKRGIKVSKLLSKADKMSVEPIQYILIRIIEKIFKCKNNYKALIKINNYIYFISIKNKKLIYSKIIEEKENTLNKLIKEELSGDNLLVDINLKNIITERILEDELIKNINFINLKEKLDYEISKV